MNNFLRSYLTARDVIMTGLLACLLFSSGEGIHLFPFPPSQDVHGFDIKVNGEKIGYQENAQRIELTREKFQSRAHRDEDNCTAALFPSDKVPNRSISAAAVSYHTASYSLFTSQRFARHIRDRAPPVL